MPSHCPPREALQTQLRKRVKALRHEADTLERLARQLQGTNLTDDVVTRIWHALSEQTPGMERPPRG